MSTDAEDLEISAAGVPELTALGKRIELLRIERRMSKRILAQRAGTSRQQLWRVMTGKSELTSSLCARLSEVLEVDSRWLRDAPDGSRPDLGHDDYGSNGSMHPLSVPRSDGVASRATDPARSIASRVRFAGDHPGETLSAGDSNAEDGAGRGFASLCETLEDYVLSPTGLERAIDGMPLNDDGRRLKRALLNAVEEAAESHRTKLPLSFFELRRQVVNGER